MKKVILIFSVLVVIIYGCKHNHSCHYTYQPPENIGDGLETGTMAEVGMDTLPLEQAVDSICTGRYREIHSILIFRDGMLVFEKYFRGHKFQYEMANHLGELVEFDMNGCVCSHIL